MAQSTGGYSAAVVGLLMSLYTTDMCTNVDISPNVIRSREKFERLDRRRHSNDLPAAWWQTRLLVVVVIYKQALYRIVT
jgi:hypothetical protein